MSVRDLGEGFKVIDNSMILQFDSEVFKKFYSQIDFASFEIIQSHNVSTTYFKDNNHVYLASFMNPFAILQDANPQDFSILDISQGHAQTSQYDYVYDQKLPYRFTDRTELSGLYSRVGRLIYFADTEAMPDADLDSFVVMQGDWVGNLAKDKQHVYFRQFIVKDADTATFELLPECFSDEYYREQDHTFYAKDKHFAYYIDTIHKEVKQIKSKSLDDFHFKVIDEIGYAFDREYRYCWGKRTSLKKL